MHGTMFATKQQRFVKQFDQAMDNDQTFLRRFIEIYREHPALWDSSSRDYMKKSNRDVGHNALLAFVQNYKKSATVFDVRRKINSMRSSYRREFRKMKSIHAAGRPYKPKLWWFGLMDFLKDFEKEYESEPEQPSLCDEDVYITPESDVVHSSTPPSTSGPTAFGTGERIPVMPADHEAEYDSEELLTESTSQQDYDNMEELPRSHRPHSLDEYRATAEAWAWKLRKLRPDQRIFAEKFIGDILFEGQLRTLHRNSLLLNAYTEQEVDKLQEMTM